MVVVMGGLLTVHVLELNVQGGQTNVGLPRIVSIQRGSSPYPVSRQIQPPGLPLGGEGSRLQCM